MNRHKHTLSDYLDRARRADALLPAEEMQALLQRSPQQAGRFRHHHRVTAVAAVTVLCAGAVWWFARDTDTTTVQQRTAPAVPAGREEADTYIEYHWNTPGVRGTLPAYLQRKNISGVHLLRLNDKELLRLGLRGLPDGVVQQYEGRQKNMPATMKKKLRRLNYVGDSPSETYLCWLTLTPRGQEYRWLPAEEQDVPLRRPLYPRLVTDAAGRTRLARFEFRNVTQSMLESLERSIDIHSLLPVWVPCGTNDSTGDGYVYWYEATAELMEALPERVRTAVGREAAGVGEVRVQTQSAFREGRPVPVPAAVLLEDRPTTDAREPVAEAQRLTGGEAVYYDIWRSAVGAVSSSLVFPNPAATPQVLLQYTLDEERVVSVTLHDIGGRCLAELVTAGRKTKGEHRDELRLPQDIRPGMYLVVIQTERGEHAVQRLIVQ